MSGIFQQLPQVLHTGILSGQRMELDTKQLWENTLTTIELSIPPASFKMWFGETHIVRIDAGTIVVGVPNQLTREWLSDRLVN